MTRAFAGVDLPEVFEAVTKDLVAPAQVIEDAFVQANPGMSRKAITVICEEGRAPAPAGAGKRACRSRQTRLGFG